MHDPAGVESGVGRWLVLLRDGSEEEQQLARTELGLILEARGLLDDAIEAYERNVAAGVADRRPYERLAALARARDDFPAEARALRALADLIAPAPPPPALPIPPSTPSALAPEPAPADPPAVDSPSDPDALDVAPDAQASEVPTDEPASSRADDGQGERSVDAAPDTALLPEPVGAQFIAPASPAPASVAPESPGSSKSPEPAQPAPADVAARSGRRLRVVLAALALPLLVLLVGLIVVQPGQPVAVPPTLPPASPTVQTIVSPTAVEIRLAADGPALLSSPTATPLPTPSPVPTLTPTPLPARCADAELRFPETPDPETAVRAAYREYLARQGVSLGAGDALFTRLAEAYVARHAEVVAGWIGVTLQRERRGLPAFSLVEYVASDLVVMTASGEFQYRATISPQGWAEIRAWPATTCEGAFVRNPANARWVELMEASVGDITWALPTPPPAR